MGQLWNTVQGYKSTYGVSEDFDSITPSATCIYGFNYNNQRFAHLALMNKTPPYTA
jgi:hypothetical protein